MQSLNVLTKNTVHIARERICVLRHKKKPLFP